LKNWIKNIEGRSTSNEVTPEYFGAKGALSLKNENIMCDTSMYFSPFRYNHFTIKTTFSQIKSIYLLSLIVLNLSRIIVVHYFHMLVVILMHFYICTFNVYIIYKRIERILTVFAQLFSMCSYITSKSLCNFDCGWPDTMYSEKGKNEVFTT